MKEGRGGLEGGGLWGCGDVGMRRRGDEGKALFYHTSIKSCYAMHVPRRSFFSSFLFLFLFPFSLIA